MNMLFIHWLFNERLIKAICWALLHSLWQGLVFTIVAAIIILFTRKSSPVLRYNLYKAFEPPSYWKQRITELSKSLHIEYDIMLLESAIIKVPMVLGILKPVVLVPLGLVSSLPPEQVEAVLLHELAHIRRRDYLVNL